MFFNHIIDPAERTNLIDDPKLKSEIERLARLLLAHMEQTDDPQTTHFKKVLNDWRTRPANNPI